MNTATGRKAFTLIELIVVIVVIGILAAIAVVGFGALIDRTRQEAVDSAAQSFDREYRGLLAYESGSQSGLADADYDAIAQSAIDAAAGDNTVISSAVVADGTVSFSSNGKTACLVLTADPAVASTFTCDGSDDGEEPGASQTTITSVSPNSNITPGTPVTVTGTNLNGWTWLITQGPPPAPYEGLGSVQVNLEGTEMTFTAPVPPAGGGACYLLIAWNTAINEPAAMQQGFCYSE
jgi:prepilin-type N-terminal cleavage/methylation domain-containing protein